MLRAKLSVIAERRVMSPDPNPDSAASSITKPLRREARYSFGNASHPRLANGQQTTP